MYLLNRALKRNIAHGGSEGVGKYEVKHDCIKLGEISV